MYVTVVSSDARQVTRVYQVQCSPGLSFFGALVLVQKRASHVHVPCNGLALEHA